MFTFLRQEYKFSIAFDPTCPAINMNEFKECKRKYLYGKLKEAITPNAPE